MKLTCRLENIDMNDFNVVIQQLKKKRKLSDQSVKQRAFGKNALVTLRSNRHLAYAQKMYAVASHPQLPHQISIMIKFFALIQYLFYLRAIEYVHYDVPPIIRTNPRITNYSADTFRLKFRFEQHQALPLMYALGLRPGTTIHVKHTDGHSSKWDSEEAFLFFLARFTQTCRLTDFEEEHGRDYSQLSRLFNAMVELVFAHTYMLLWDNLEWFVPRFNYYNQAVRDFITRQNHGFMSPNCLTNIISTDGTRRRFCRPSGPYNIQNAVYNGAHKIHCLQFQASTAPDGMIVNLFGPVIGKMHDSNTHRRSCLNIMLRNCQAGRLLQGTSLEDKAYDRKSHCTPMLKATRGHPLTDYDKQCNAVDSTVRVPVAEWGFGDIVAQCPMIDKPKGLKIHVMAIAKYYYVAAILKNAMTCLRANNCATHFQCEAPRLNEYFRCADLIGVGV